MNQTCDQLYLLDLHLARKQDQHLLQLVRLHLLLRLSLLHPLYLLQAMALAKVLLLYLPQSLVRFRLYQAMAQLPLCSHRALINLDLHLVRALPVSLILQCLPQSKPLLHQYSVKGLAKLLPLQ